MAKVRQDAWSHEDDLLLAETVLRHVREGSTQLKAFEEVGDQLNRTSAACGFRWNAEVRGDYVEAMELAKRQRKERKRSLAKATKTKTSTVSNVENESLSEHITLQRVITFLQQLDEDTQANQQAKLAIKRLEKENKSLKEEIEQLQNKLDETEKQFTTIKEDYETFIQIMERARKMTVFDDSKMTESPSFTMDKNGNLQKIIQNLN
ncbi:MAG TPA: RsfA family transcriptional regulator [Bacillota bacterium]|nr:RsfA family transcriptional regulator [Bacillota bacterium]